MNRYYFDKENHIHYLDNKPLLGTSTVVGIISKGSALSWWSSQKCCETFGWMKPKDTDGKAVPLSKRIDGIMDTFNALKDMTPGDFVRFLDKAYRAHNEKLEESAVKGTSLHADLEEWIVSCMSCGAISFGLEDSHDDLRIQEFKRWAFNNVNRFLWCEAHCFSDTLKTGGITDFGAELKDGRIVVGDHKSSAAVYQSHLIQSSGYALEIEENGLFDADGEQIGSCSHIDGVVVFPFGAKKFKPVFNTLPIEEYKMAFKHAAELYRFVQKEKLSKEGK